MILELARDNISKVYFGCCGSDANNTKIKLVIKGRSSWEKGYCQA